jgi:hypothetical protein
MIDYLVGLVGALGVSDQRKRTEIASEMEKALIAGDAEEGEVLRNRLKERISPYGRFESASGQSNDLMDALERAISAMLLKEGRFFRSYAILVVVLSDKLLSHTEVGEVNRTMRRLSGTFTNIMVKPFEAAGIDGFEVRLFSIGLHETDPGKNARGGS